MNNFDWVSARGRCSLGEIFEKLKLDVASDVEQAQARRPVRDGMLAHYGFKCVVSDSGDKITVFVNGNNIRRSSSFHLTEDSIEVLDQSGHVKFSAMPTLNNKGECRLRINEEEQELWYIRKLALEDLFFTTY